LMLPLVAASIVSSIAVSSPRQVKMMSALPTASSRLKATVDLPEGSFVLRSVARFCVRLEDDEGLIEITLFDKVLAHALSNGQQGYQDSELNHCLPDPCFLSQSMPIEVPLLPMKSSYTSKYKGSLMRRRLQNMAKERRVSGATGRKNCLNMTYCETGISASLCSGKPSQLMLVKTWTERGYV
jgi:hypothetical protein